MEDVYFRILKWKLIRLNFCIEPCSMSVTQEAESSVASWKTWHRFIMVAQQSGGWTMRGCDVTSMNGTK